MRLLVSGDRKWTEREYLFEMLDQFHANTPVSVVIEGCAKGADSLAEEWAAINNIPIEHYPAKWNEYGKAAGPIRNLQMLREGKPDAVFAFHPDLTNSRGTRHMVESSLRAVVPTYLFAGTVFNSLPAPEIYGG